MKALPIRVQPTKSPVESVNNLFTIMDVVSDSKTVKFFRESYANCYQVWRPKKAAGRGYYKITTPIYEQKS